MSLLNEFVNSIEDAQESELVQDKIAIIEHKIKFRDRVPVFIPAHPLLEVPLFAEMLQLAGAFLVSSPEQAKSIIFLNRSEEVSSLMTQVVSEVDMSWEAAQLKQIYLIIKPYTENNLTIDVLEALAEIIHPGFFIFGFEGTAWLQFEL